jgi:RecB family exonuclease
MRVDRPPTDAPEFHGFVGPPETRPWSISALETYLQCPFKFFARHLLRLEEEPDDGDVMDPREQGRFVHAVFEAFYRAWRESGHLAVTPQNLEDARRTFAFVAEQALQQLPESEGALERTRLLGSAAAVGLGETVLRLEADRPAPVVERLIEHRLQGNFTIRTSSGPREVALACKADRLDLLDDGTFRLLDYKLGWPPNRARALQLPVYAVCAEQRLADDRGRRWTLGEAAYVAFKGPRRVVPLFTSTAERGRVLAAAEQRLSDTLDSIARGDFPPRPDDVFRCETCSAAAICRKDYV